MFGFGEMAAINAVISGLKAVNDMVATAKESGSNAASFGSIVAKFTDLDSKIRSIEERSVTRPMSVEESLRISLAKRQCQTAMSNIRDAMLMSGQMATFKEMMDRVEESQAQHNKLIAKKKKAAQERRKLMKEIGQWTFIGLFCFGLVMVSLFAWIKTR